MTEKPCAARFISDQVDDIPEIAAMVVVLADGRVRTFVSAENEKRVDVYSAILAGAQEAIKTGTLN